MTSRTQKIERARRLLIDARNALNAASLACHMAKRADLGLILSEDSKRLTGYAETVNRPCPSRSHESE